MDDAVGGFASLGIWANGVLSWIGESDIYGVTTSFLAMTFLLSGILKLRRPHLAAFALVDFHVTRTTNASYGRALGALEVFFATGLLARLWPLVFQGLVVVLLSTFCYLIARSLVSGRSFACMCFGDADGSLSRWTLLRTAALLTAAAMLLATTARGVHFSVDTGPVVLQACVAISVLAILFLVSRFPRLLRLNAEWLD